MKQILVLIFLSLTVNIFGQSVKAKSLDKKVEVKFYKDSDSLWRCKTSAGTYKLTLEKDSYIFSKSDKKIESAKLKSGKLKFSSATIAKELKITGNDIKVYLKSTYKLSADGDKVKIKKDDKEIGFVKYYSDTKKLKLKDTFGKEIFICKDMKKVNFFLAPFLFDIEKDKQVFLALFLFSQR